MIINEVIQKLKTEYPPHLAMAWDNPGLQVGRTDREVKRVLVALDATGAVVEECISWGAQLLVTHHPLLMSGIKTVSNENFIGKKVLDMAENGIAHYAMHTNYDVTMMNKLAAQRLQLSEFQVLEATGALEDGSPCGIGCTGMLPRAMTARECCEYIKKAFSLECVRIFGDQERTVRKIAVCPGSGKSEVGAALGSGADIYVSGDIGHHDGLDAVDQGLVVIDAGHYGVEQIFIPQIAGYLRREFPVLEVRETSAGHPFATV